jgi:hypothetical protein
MTEAEEALADYRELIVELGQPIAIRRYTGTGASRTFVDTPTMAYVRSYESGEIIGAITYGDQRAIALVDDLAAVLPVTTNDKLIVGAKEYAIKNPMKRVVGGTLIALEIHAAG